MASSSARSIHSSIGVETIEEERETYLYVLRVAYLATLSSAPIPLPSAANGSALAVNTSLPQPGASLRNSVSASSPLPSAPLLKSSVSFRPSEGWTSALLGKDNSGSSSSAPTHKGVKYPKELLKVLDGKLQRIAQGQDREEHKQVRLRATIAVFWNQFGTPDFTKKLLEERKIEELILRFVAIASKKLRELVASDEGLSADAWKEELNTQVGTFVKIVKECLQSKDVGKVPLELFTRLDTYYDSIKPTTLSSEMSLQLPRASTFSSHSPSPSVSSEHGFEPLAPRHNGFGPTNILEMPLVLAVGQLFARSQEELRRDVVAMRRLCTEAAAFQDLKTLINNLATGRLFPTSRADFETAEAFQSWKKMESTELQELLIEMLQRDPTLVKSTRADSIPGGAGPSRPSSLVEAHEVDPAESFYYIPSDPKLYYQRLFDVALAHDINHMRSLPPEESVPLTILSPNHTTLLDECAQRWRVLPSFRVADGLKCVVERYEAREVPLACVGEALQAVTDCAEVWKYWQWPILDRSTLSQTLSPLFNDLLTRFFDIFQNLGSLTYVDVLPLLTTIHENTVFREDTQGLPALLADLETGMRKFVAIMYSDKEEDVSYEAREAQHNSGAGDGSSGEGVGELLQIVAWITSEAKRFSKLFRDPLVGEVDVPALFLSVAVPAFVDHLIRCRPVVLAPTRNAGGTAIFDLYRRALELRKLHDAFNRSCPLSLDLPGVFEPCVWQWLASTDTKTSEWVKAAIASDNFKAEFGEDLAETEKHSSSIIDLFDSCKSAMNFILDLKWPDEYSNARFLTRLSQTIAKSIEQYSLRLETLFLAEMFPRVDDGGAITQDVARPSAWVTKARLAVQGDKKIEPFVFIPESCVKLNNIQAARRLLDSMYTTFNVDQVARIVASQGPPEPEQSPEKAHYLFTIKMVLCENLVNPDENSRAKLDPFLILSNPRGDRVAKTRTLYETNDPRWEETVDVSVVGDLWIRATIYNRNLVDHHDTVAFAYLHLNPYDFGDFLTRDVWLPLEDARGTKLEGRLLLRISMEGEKDDIQFYFGRAFRSLKRAENDMTRTIVDKMSPFVRHYLSRNILSSLAKPGYNFDIDLEKVRGDFSKVSTKLNAFVRDAISQNSTPVIPPVRGFEDEAAVPATVGKKKRRGPLTDQEIENAIGDLFDYLNVTFGTLTDALSQPAWDLVIGRLWKTILSTIEGLIVPPLSDRPTEMRPLSERELDIVFKWLGFLVNFFHASGEGVPLEELRNPRYRALVEARMFYDWSSDQLMEEAVQSMRRQLQSTAPANLGRTKSVYQQRNLGTIRARKIGKKKTQDTSGETILRILRMRPDASDFLKQQLSTLASLQADQARKQRLGSLQRRTDVPAGARGRSRPSAQRLSSGQRGLPTVRDEY